MIKKLLLFFTFLAVTFAVAAQEEEPKVGLVLSGGGAKGLAHIGALKVIEEAGVRIDYIGGTSMGAIIGALYAAGYTADELDSIFRKTNFNILIQDELPRSAKTFYEKREAEKYAITLPFDDFEISFPAAFSKGQNLYNLISQLTLHLENRNNFRELPIPFFAVATNVETGEEVILNEGYLPQAISASAAIPSLFNPVLVDGNLLTDGGVVNNYPVEELRSRGMEIIIGVDVQDSLMTKEELGSGLEILTQISNFRTIEQMESKIEKTNVYIDPEIESYSVLSFDKGKEIIKAGEMAARQKIEELRAIAQKQDFEPRQKKKIRAIDSLLISDVRIEGNSDYPRAYILGKLRLQYPEKISFEELRYGINNLSATNNFNRINYQLEKLNGGFMLILQLDENPRKMFLRLGVHYDNLYKSAALVNLTRKSLFFTNDIASLDLALGDHTRYEFNYYIDKGFYWSVGFKSRYNSFDQGVSFDFVNQNARLQNEINQLELDYEDFTNQLYIETLFRQIFSLGMGVEHKYLNITSATLGEPSPEEPDAGVFDHSNYYSPFGYLRFDSLDNTYFPSKGIFFKGDFHWYLLSSDHNEDFSPFSIVKGEVGYVFSPVDQLSFTVSSEAGFRIGSSKNNIFDFFLGGYGNDLINNFVPFYGYDFISLSGDSFIKGGLEMDYEFFRRNHLLLNANFANVENELFGSGNWFSFPDYSGYAIGYGLETFLGPVEVKYSISPEAKESLWFFSIGFWF